MEGQQSRKVYPTQGMGSIWKRMFPYKRFYNSVPVGAISHGGVIYEENHVLPVTDSITLDLNGGAAPPLPVLAGAVSNGTTTDVISGVGFPGSKAVFFDASVPAYTDDTANAASAAVNDMALVTAAGTVNDAYLIGDDNTFDGVVFIVGQVASGITDYVVEYTLGGGSWSALTTTLDQINNWETSGPVYLFWENPVGWNTDTFATFNKYWIRIRITGYLIYAQQPLGTQAYISKY